MGNMWHVKNWFRVGHNISWKLNYHTLLGFLYLYWPNEYFYNQSLKKHDFILSYLKQENANIIEKYKKIKETEFDNSINEKRIWVLWWQGEDNAPSLIKACISSIRDNSNGAKVIIVSKDNIDKLVTLPQFIIEKKNKNWISFAQLSDIIRFLLLEKYGGLWLDATIFTSSPIPCTYFSYPFFSQHTKWRKTCFVQHNLYHGFIIASRPHAKLVSFAKDMFLEYWKTHDTLVDYLMIDYIIMLAYQEFPDIKSEIDSLPWSSERLYDLVRMLDKPFEENEFERLKSECIFSKLDWHRKYRTTKKGRKTYYGTIVEDAFEYD